MEFKRMTSILSRMIDNTITNTNEINDFSIGSAIRAMYEAVAIELESFSMLTRENIREGIEEGIYQAFDFKRRTSQRAFGNIELTFNNALQQDLIISRGSSFGSTQEEYPQIYETLVEYVVPKGAITATLEVYCTVPGTYGNVPAGVIDMARTPIQNLRSVTNPNQIQTGTDEEPLDSLRSHFNSFIESRGRATKKALEYGARQVEEVSGVYVDEYVGYVIIYAHDRNGNLSDRIRQLIEVAIEDYRPAGIKTVVRPITKKTLPIELTVTLSDKTRITDLFKEKVANTVAAYLNGMTVAQDLILSDLVQLVMNIDDQLVYDVKIDNYTSNVTIEKSEIIRAGEVKINLV